MAFNAGGMWSSAAAAAAAASASARHINCSSLSPEFFLVAPASSFQHHPEPATATNFDPNSLNAVGIGVIPLLPSPGHPGGSATATDEGGGGIVGSVATCQDCGNQAKKDCSHRRCRSCCKSRGYDCATHVKSTWVSAARRRRKQLIMCGSSQSTSGSKKPRLDTASHSSTSNKTTPLRSFATCSSSHQDTSFKELLPEKVRASAVFKCVRVSAIDEEEGEDEYAYQAVVRICGHVFKGFLYDQGIDHRGLVLPNISQLHLDGNGNGDGGDTSTATNNDNDIIYGSSIGGLLGPAAGSSYVTP